MRIDNNRFFCINNISISFGGLEAVKDFSMKMKKSEIIGLIGPNGSGKTTLLNIITGLYKPKKGEIFFLNHKINGLKPHIIGTLGISRTFQNIRLFENLTVKENVLIGRHSILRSNLFTDLFSLKYKIEIEKNAEQEIDEILKKFDMSKFKDRISSNLPYGIKRKLEITRAFASNPKLLLLDEPSAGMNAQETRDLIKIIKKISENNIGVLLIEHNIKMVMNICKRIVVMEEGKKIAEGNPNHVKNDPKVKEAYLGKEGIENVIS